MILLSAVGLVGIASMRIAKRNDSGGKIRGLVPHDLDGWTVVDLPLGLTETLTNDAERLLQFDEFVYRSFTKGTDSFRIYVAYWGPEKMPVGEVAKHTPDTCWPLNGISRLYHQSSATFRMGEVSLKGGELRLFGVGYERIHVIYWHLVNGRAHDYSQRYDWSIRGFRHWIDKIILLWTDGRAEQYLIRVDSNISIDRLMLMPDFILAFSKLGCILNASEKMVGISNS